ncbi:MAG: hypothetical protein C0484_11240 [Rhodospirillum sp.]|nr:hypothetical protein [Rhodospirillum sp.]
MPINNFTDKSTSGFDEDALTTSTLGERVRNFARLTTSGDLADGISANADEVSILNLGEIETTGPGAAGIIARGSNARIVNFGSVETLGGIRDPDPDVDGDEAFAEGIVAEGDGFRVVNFGRVHVEGEASSCLVGIGNDGIVTNYGVLDTESVDSSAIAVDGDQAQAVNAGLIRVRGGNNTAMFAVGEDAVGLNRGLILLDAPGTTGVEGVIVNTNVINKGVIHVESERSFGLAGFGDGHQIKSFGNIDVHGFFSGGIEARGIVSFDLAGLDLEILNAGRITTDGDLAIGIALGISSAGKSEGFGPAENGTIINRGVIETEGDGAAGIAMNGNGHHLVNSGRIVADGGAFDGDPLGLFRAAGVVVIGDDALVENTRSGVISSRDADSAAVELNVIEQDGSATADMAARLENYGLIKGAEIAVLGGAGDETVVNCGRIVGDVVLGDGVDTFACGKGGSLAGDLFLGGGDDIVLVADGSGILRIADFQAGAAGGDVVDLSAFFADFDDVMSHASQKGGDTVIALDRNDRLVLENTQLSTLDVSDFQLA